MIICGIRNVSPEHSLEMAELAVAYKGRGVVGFDLAGAEYDHPAKHHKAAFQLVRDNNINVTIHAGEAYGPESIAQAIHVCGAHRIGHGCRLRENGDLLHYVNDHRIPLECCPSSNVQTGAIRDLASHPLKLYKNLGLRVTVNTDNRLVTDTTVSKELWLCHTQMGLGLKDIKQIILSRLQERVPPLPREAAVPAEGERGARGLPRRGAHEQPSAHVVDGDRGAVVEGGRYRGIGERRTSRRAHTRSGADILAPPCTNLTPSAAGSSPRSRSLPRGPRARAAGRHAAGRRRVPRRRVPLDLVTSKRGDRVAWLADDHGEHQVWSAAGPEFAPKLVAHWSGDDGRPLSDLTVSDDGARLAFVRGVDEGHPVNPTSDPRGPKAEVWVVDAAGASAPVLVGEGTSPVIRPDGVSVDLLLHHQLRRAHAQRQAPVRTHESAGAGDSGDDDVVFHARGETSPPVWSPDGSRFAFVSDRGDHWLVGVFDPGAQRITWMAPSVDRDSAPVWSPDGKRIAFLRFRGRETPEPLDTEFFVGHMPVSVVVADATTGEGRVVVPEDATGGFAQGEVDGPPLLWAAGDCLVFRSERDGWVRLYAARADGAGEAAALTPTGCEVTGDALSPDRATVIATTNCGDVERRHLLAVSMPAGAARALTQGHGIEWAVSCRRAARSRTSARRRATSLRSWYFHAARPCRAAWARGPDAATCPRSSSPRA